MDVVAGVVELSRCGLLVVVDRWNCVMVELSDAGIVY